MRPDLELIEKIEQYLTNNLSSEDRAAFERRMSADPELRNEVRSQQHIMRGIERATIKEKIQAAKIKFYHGRSLMKWGIGGLSAVVLIAAAILFYVGTVHGSNHEYKLPELNEMGEKQWVDADKNVPAQLYSIDAAKDTVIETKGGIVMAIRSNTFVDDNGKPVNGKIDVVVKEALDPASILSAGLSTMSGDKLLESGGMFYLDARKNKQILKIDPAKGIYAEIPTREVKDGMQLFAGKRKADGKIDWVNPKPLEHDLVPMDITSLNFYPPSYLDSLKLWGYAIANKKFTDSLYYSFASLFTQAKDSLTRPTTMDNTISNELSEIVADTTMYSLRDGKTLFQSKCASCHNVFLTSTGPRLGGIIFNEYYQGSIGKMTHWINNVNKLVYSDPHYIQLKNQFGSVMQQLDLSEKEVGAIFKYIESTYQGGSFDVSSDDGVACGINPAKIKSIWNDQFQNTILATREFEERLRWIHYFRDPALLDLYVNNLDKDLSYTDSIAAINCPKGAATNPFPFFAARHDGRVKSGSNQFEMLRHYYANKTKAFTDAIAKTQNEFWTKQAELDIEAGDKKAQHELDSSKRMRENFEQELDLNVKEAYRQLGYDTAIRRSVGPAYQAIITTTGWCNVDRAVYASTVTRTTLNYTDSESGKKAIINYNSVSIQVVQWNEYNRLYVYLLPNKLNSFMRLDSTNGIFSEKLNELMKYDLLCIAYKDEQPSFYSQKDIQAGDHPSIVLNKTSKEELQQILEKVGPGTESQALQKEIDYFQFEISDSKRQGQNLALRELANKIRQLLFQCFDTAPPAIADSVKKVHRAR